MSILLELIKKSASHNAYEDIHEDMYVVQSNMVHEYWSSKYKAQPWRLVPSNTINKIWKDFSKEGIVKNPKGLDNITKSFKENSLRLYWNNVISGHTQLDPEKEFEEYFKDTSESEWNKFVDWCIELPDGSYRITDYGMNKLIDNLALALDTDIAEEKIVYLDMFLNVVHQRSDLASWFVEGGSATLHDISHQGLAESIYQPSREQVFVSHDIVDWFTNDLNFFGIVINPKYQRNKATKQFSFDIHGKEKWDVAPNDLPEDFYILKFDSLKSFLYRSTYRMTSNSKAIPTTNYKLLPPAELKKLNKLLLEIGWDDLVVPIKENSMQESKNIFRTLLEEDETELPIEDEEISPETEEIPEEEEEVIPDEFEAYEEDLEPETTRLLVIDKLPCNKQLKELFVVPAKVFPLSAIKAILKQYGLEMIEDEDGFGLDGIGGNIDMEMKNINNSKKISNSYLTIFYQKKENSDEYDFNVYCQ